MAGGAITSGVIGLAGGLAGNSARSSEAKKGRRFTERQMKHKHQWEMWDLRKAGLNPILAAGGTPGTGPSPVASQENPVSEGVNSALQAAQVKNVQAQTRKTNIEADAIQDIKKPIQTGAGMVDQGLEAIKEGAQSAGVNAAKGVIHVEKLVEESARKVKKFVEKDVQSRKELLKKVKSWIYEMLRDDPTKGWLDERAINKAIERGIK